jgi:hypothetical protein
MANPNDWFTVAAVLRPDGPANTLAAIPIIARKHRTTGRITSTPVDMRKS